MTLIFRKFESWASRNSSKWKLESEAFSSAINNLSFDEYMKTKQIIWWEYRRWDNWQKWIPTEAIFPSLIRHIEVLKLLMDWCDVRECNEEWETELYVIKWDTILSKRKTLSEDAIKKEIVDELNAIRFNSEAMKLNFILDKHE